MRVQSTVAMLPDIPPQALIVISRALQSLATPIVALLVTTAAGLGAGGEAGDAISFCNVLFVGNLCAALVVAFSFGPRRIATDLARTDKRDRLEILAFAALAALLSAWIFTALETTTVTNAVLLARLGPVLFAVGSATLARRSLTRSEYLGFALIALGVVATTFAGTGFIVVRGDVLILASTVVFALVQLISKRLLPRTGLPALVFARNFFSAAVFFVIANVLYGPEHFTDAFYGPLWGIMIVYAAVVIVAAQLTWYRALGAMSPSSVARWTVFTPVLAVVYAFAINGEQPGTTQLTALTFITLGVIVSNVGKLIPAGMAESTEGSLAGS